MFVKPKKGETVVDPATGQALPADGAEVGNTPFWARMERQRRVDCTRGEDEPAPVRGKPVAPRKAKRPVDIPAGGGKVAGALSVGARRKK